MAASRNAAGDALQGLRRSEPSAAGQLHAAVLMQHHAPAPIAVIRKD